MSVDNVWGFNNVISLIKLYQKHVLLWDSSHRDYRNKLKKNEAWQNIAKSLKLSRKTVETKIHTLRSQFMRERKRVAPSKPGGDVKPSGWFAYEPMLFLLKGKADSSNVDTLDTNSLQSQDTFPRSPEEEAVHIEHQETAQESFDHLETQSSSTSSQGRSPSPPNLPHRNTLRSAPISSLLRYLLKRRAPNNRIAEALKVLRAARNQTPQDNFDVYGRYIAAEMRAINDERSVIVAKKHISDILFNASIGNYRVGSNATVDGCSKKTVEESCCTASSEARSIVKVEDIEEQIIPDVPNSHCGLDEH